VNCAKTPEPIEMSFALGTWVGPRNYVLDGGSFRSPVKRDNCKGGGRAARYEV